nr:unnamed protein product [Rangifer tarandus platyrhynchus]
MHSGRQGLPKASFLVLVLSLTIWNRDHAPEEEVWGTLSRMWLCAEGEHCVFGESRELLPHMCLREGNLEYQQLPDSHLACYEFLWGPQAYAETSKSGVVTRRSYHTPQGRGRAERSNPTAEVGASAERSNPTSKERRLCWRSRAERSYSLFKVRRGGREEIPLIQGKEQRLRFPGAAMKRYPTSKCD